MHQKLVPGPFLILVGNQKQPLHARNYFKYVINEHDYEKQKRSENSDQSLFRLQVQKSSSITDILPDQV